MFSEHARFAIQVAGIAGDVIRDYYEQRMNPIWTGRSHFKTAADDASEAVIREMIHERYPTHNLWSEEGGKSDAGSNFTWVWDAVDGTIPMYTGICDHFSVCGALFEGNEPTIGVANAVQREEVYAAEVGEGAYCNQERIHVSKETEIAHVIMGVDSGKHDRAAHIPFLNRAFQDDGVLTAISSACASIPLLLVASGVMHAYLATSLEPEDMAAAVVVIREAGGTVTNMKGEEWRLGDTSILAANPVLHEKLGKFFNIF